MHLQFEPPPVYFMHVPKTGGTALGRWLRVTYSRHSYIDLNAASLGGLTQETLHRFACYHDWHHGRGMYDLIGCPALPVVTLLRMPVERTVSEFYERQRAFVRNPTRYRDEYRLAIAPIIDQSLAACIDYEFVQCYLMNVQTTCLGRQFDCAAFLKGGAQAAAGQRMVLPFNLTDRIGRNDHTLRLSNAHAWLDEMAVVGLFEHYHESLLLVADLLGIPVPATMPQVNLNPQRTAPSMRYRDQLAPDLITRLEDMNRYDLELYAHAAELFEQQWARYRARPRRTYSVAPRLRIPVRRAGSGLKEWLRRTWPGLMPWMRQGWAKCVNRQARTRSPGQP